MELNGHKVILIRDMESLDKSLMSVEDFLLVGSSDGGKTFKSSIFDTVNIQMLELQVVEVDKIRDRDGNLIEDPSKLPANVIRYGQYVYKVEATDITVANLDRVIGYGLQLEEECYGRDEDGKFFQLDNCYAENGNPNPDLKNGYKTKKMGWNWYENGITIGVTDVLTKNLEHNYISTKQVDAIGPDGETTTVNRNVLSSDIIFDRRSYISDGLFKTVERGWGSLFRFVNYKENTLTQTMYGQPAYSKFMLGNMNILELDQSYNEKKFDLLDRFPSGWVDFSDIGENYFGGITKGLTGDGHPGYWFWDEYLGWYWFTPTTFPNVYVESPIVLAGNYSTINYGGTVEQDGRVLISEGKTTTVSCDNNHQGINELNSILAPLVTAWMVSRGIDNIHNFQPGENFKASLLVGRTNYFIMTKVYGDLQNWLKNFPNSTAYKMVADIQSRYGPNNFLAASNYIDDLTQVLIPYLVGLEIESNKCIEQVSSSPVYKKNSDGTTFYVPKDSKGNLILSEIIKEEGDYEPAGWSTFRTNGVDSRTKHIYIHNKGCWSDLNKSVLVEGECSDENFPSPNLPNYDPPARCPFEMDPENLTKFYNRKYEPGEQEYSAGDNNVLFTVPNGVYSITVEALGGGGSGGVVTYQYPNSFSSIAGSGGGNTSFRNITSGLTLTAQGGDGGNLSRNRGKIISTSESFIVEKLISQDGEYGASVNSSNYSSAGVGKGGNSQLSTGTSYTHQSYVCSPNATLGAGSGAGFVDNHPGNTYGGDAGAYLKYIISVNPGDEIMISVGLGGSSGSSTYTRGGDVKSCSGGGGNGFLKLTW